MAPFNLYILWFSNFRTCTIMRSLGILLKNFCKWDLCKLFTLHLSIFLANQWIIFTMNQNCFLKVVIKNKSILPIPFHFIKCQIKLMLRFILMRQRHSNIFCPYLIYLLCFYSILKCQSTSTDNPAMRSPLFTASYQLWLKEQHWPRLYFIIFSRANQHLW